MDSIAIIGTREPDTLQRKVAFELASILSQRFTIRTGAAFGIDQAVMEGSQGQNLDVYLPWSTYNRDIIPPTARIVVYDPTVHIQWTESVKRYHPAYTKLTRGALALHARNFGIISGARLVIAFPDENGGGGTGQGIRIARGLGILTYSGIRGMVSNDSVARLLRLMDERMIEPTRNG